MNTDVLSSACNNRINVHSTGKDHLFKWLSDKLFVLIFLGYFVFVFVPSLKIGLLITLLSVIVLVANRPYKIKGIDVFVVGFTLWGCFSIILAIINGRVPISQSISKFCSAYLPAFFYFIAKKRFCSFKEKDFLFYLLVALCFCFLVGMYWYIKDPSYYIRYLDRLGLSTDGYFLEKRFSSFLGSSIGIGLFSVLGLIISFRKFADSKKIIYLIISVCMVIMSILSMQRSSYILIAFFLLWNLLAMPNKKKMILLIIALAIISSIFTRVFENKFYELFNQVLGRLSQINFDSMINSRSNQWSLIPSMGVEVLVGYGAGSLTHHAADAINDGAFFNIVGETGLVGFVLFFVPTVVVMTKSIKYRKMNSYFLVCFMICSAFLINSIGSNCILYMEMAPIYWFALGKLASRGCKQR